VVFHIPEEFQEGNAVVAARNAENEILWSWHIWLTDTPAEQVYYNEAGTLMDRNLGALSAVPGEVAALGLLYQWGRKDPFISGGAINSSTQAKSTITWPAIVTSDSMTGTIEYTISHPTTFIENNTVNKDWYYTDSPAVDNTRWKTSGESKTIYDPCPAGWRVPDGGTEGVWATALGAATKNAKFDSKLKGLNLSGIFGDDETIWFPMAGSLNYSGGKLGSVGSSGIYWSATPYTSTSVYASILSTNTNGLVNTNNYGNRARAYSVRCIKE
jgi:uncharacterized protein (TIGR02145 family)